MSPRKSEKSPFAGLLAEQLKSIDIKPDPAPPRSAHTPKDKARTTAAPPPEDRSQDDDFLDAPALSDAELFQKSLEEIKPEDFYRGKFVGEAPVFEPEPGDDARRGERRAAQDERDECAGDAMSAADEADAREAVQQVRAQRLFEREVGAVAPLADGKKYRQPGARDPAEDVARRIAYRSEPPESLNTPPLAKSGEGLNQVGPLVAAQKELYERYKKRERRHEVFELNVRGDSVEDALRNVELFVHKNWKEDRHFVRIIHGRGLQSDGEPVLKPAILHWLEGPGFRYVRGYVPEVTDSGDYGSLIVELERKS